MFLAIKPATWRSGAYLGQEQVDNEEHHLQRELCSEQCEEPLRRVHVRLYADRVEVIEEVRCVVLKYQVNTLCKCVMIYLNKPLQLIEAQVEGVESELEQIPHPVVEHDLDEDAKRLFLRHLQA